MKPYRYPKPCFIGNNAVNRRPPVLLLHNGVDELGGRGALPAEQK